MRFGPSAKLPPGFVQVLLKCEGFRIKPWSKVLYGVLTAISAGAFWLIGLANPQAALWLYTPCPLHQADYILATVSAETQPSRYPMLPQNQHVGQQHDSFRKKLTLQCQHVHQPANHLSTHSESMQFAAH